MTETKQDGLSARAQWVEMTSSHAEMLSHSNRLRYLVNDNVDRAGPPKPPVTIRRRLFISGRQVQRLSGGRSVRLFDRYNSSLEDRSLFSP